MSKTPQQCPFCSLADLQVVAESELTVAFYDRYGISKGHTLVVPRQHAQSLFDLPAEVQQALWAMVARVQQILQVRFQPDGFNVGLNDGPAAGQTIMHVHIHVIPRFHGDVPDPRGGIRWIMPDKAVYWEKP